MSIHKFSYKSILIFSLISLLALGIIDLFVIIYANCENNKTFEIIQEKNPKLIKLEDIYLKTTVYHKCKKENNSFDAFIKCKLINNTNNDITNWKLDVHLNGTARLIETWNAKSSTNGNVFSFFADSQNNPVINNNTSYVFDIYINYTNTTDFKNCIITGNFKHKLTDYFIHKFIMILIVMIITALIAVTIVSHYVKREIEILNRINGRSYTIIDQTMKTFVNFIDAKDEYTKGHSTRVAKYSELLANRMGYNKQFQQDMYYMGLMHDIGKITVPDNILNKTGHLTTDEWAVIQMHTENGARLLQNFTIMPEIRDAVLYHHERYDGKGYLNHLKGDDIPLCARIICVADSYDAMSTTRCYRLKYSKERIIQELERCAGKQFDPTIAQVMIDLLKDGTI